MQNKMMKLLPRLRRMTPTNELHMPLNILKVSDIYKSNVLSFFNENLSRRSPDIFENYFKWYINWSTGNCYFDALCKELVIGLGDQLFKCQAFKGDITDHCILDFQFIAKFELGFKLSEEILTIGTVLFLFICPIATMFVHIMLIQWHCPEG